jgi:hypothetical protein
MRSWRGLKLCAERNELVDIVKNDVKFPVPCLLEFVNSDSEKYFPSPGQKYTLHNVCSAIGLKHTDMSHKTYSSCADRPDTVILTAGYKNDLMGIRNLSLGAQQWLDDESGDTKLYDANVSLAYMCGHGGMPTNNGDKPPGTFGVNPAVIDIPTGQKRNSPYNWKIFDLHENGKVFALFVNEGRFYEGTSIATSHDDSHENCTFLGYFYIGSHTVDERPEHLFEEDMKELGANADFIKKSEFRMSTHFKFHLCPAFNTEQWNKFRQEGFKTGGYTRIKVNENTPGTLTQDVKIRELSQMKINKFEILRDFIHNENTQAPGQIRQ